jgi:hypothetical protein
MATKKKAPKIVLINCKECGEEHDRNEVKRVLGKESQPYLGGFCSAFCYTKNMTEACEKQDRKEGHTI